MTLGEQPVSLSPKEYSLLEALIAHADCVVPRSRLQAMTYGWHDDIESNALECIFTICATSSASSAFSRCAASAINCSRSQRHEFHSLSVAVFAVRGAGDCVDRGGTGGVGSRPA
ncbi:helix-turn-helix domain-containing protein [Chromatium okenii]|uniref:helix-turn-helix domain-containing protein n=1 Tax=Chromatium okenii TaxID=61644 RepID=UPI003D6BD936